MVKQSWRRGAIIHLGYGRYDIDDILEKLKSPPDAAPSEPPRFALYNLTLTGGQVDFNDRNVNKTHELRALNLSVPFLSNLQSKRDVKTAPRLAFKLGNFDLAPTWATCRPTCLSSCRPPCSTPM